jgi:cell division protein FtsQ
MRKIATIAFYILLPLGILAILGFAVDSNHSKPCRSFQVRINSPAGLGFVDSSYVVNQVYHHMEKLEGKPLKAISLSKVEELVNKLYYVENSRVYRTIDGHVVADINQRKPIARVINAMNESYYIDDQGKLMRTSSQHTARVIVVTGFINARYSPNVNIHSLDNEEELSSSERLLKELDLLVRYINSDKFLSSWIDQIYVNRQGEFELVPRNGIHTIEFGRAEDMKSKFDKLMKFYQNGLTHVGWGHYKRINLKYKNQVVCSK